MALNAPPPVYGGGWNANTNPWANPGSQNPDWLRGFNERQPTQFPSSGLFQPPNWLYDSGAAVRRAMSDSGMNAAGFNPYARALRSNADNLARTLLARNILGPQGQNPGWGTDSALWNVNLADTEGMQKQLQSLVQEAASGGRVLGGWNPQQLAMTQPWIDASNAGSTNVNANIVADYLYNPQQAADFATSLMYGGMSPRFQAAAAAPWTNLGDYYQRLLERGEDRNRTLLDLFVNTPSQQWR